MGAKRWTQRQIRDMVYGEAALGRDVLPIPVAEGIPQVPADMIPSSKCRPRNSAGRCLVKVSPYQIGPRCLQQNLNFRPLLNSLHYEQENPMAWMRHSRILNEGHDRSDCEVGARTNHLPRVLRP
jgi:hypothetical protein